MADLQTEPTRGGVSFEASKASRGTNQVGVRLYNERVVLSIIRRNGPLPKAEIARLTGLAAMTTTTIMNRLEADGLLLRQDKLRGRIGQPSTPYGLNPVGAFALGLKIGRRSAELVLVDFQCHIRARLRESYLFPETGGVMHWFENAIKEISAGVPAAGPGRIVGIGVAMPFELWNWQSEVGAPHEALDAWRTFDVRAAVEGIAGLDVQICNDATAACGAELMLGSGNSFRDFLYVFFGSFIGGGVALNHRLFPGRTGNAAAFGSMPVVSFAPDGRVIRSQLIREASIYLLEHRIREAGGDPSSIWLRPSDWDDFGEPLELWLDDAARALAPALVAGAAVIDFQAIVIDGAFPTSVRERLVAKVKAEVGKFDLQGLSPVEIREGAVGPDARELGAAILPLFDAYAPDHEVLLKEA